MTLSFENTEIAFRAKSDSELRRSYWLFKTIEHPWLVKAGTLLLKLALALRLPVEGLIKLTIFRQFCGGETIDECRGTIAELQRFRIGTILDYSVEGMKSEASLESTAREVMHTIDLAKGNPSIPFCVFKVTGVVRFGLLAALNGGGPPAGDEAAEWERAKARVLSLCQRAHDHGVRLFIDAEESWIQDTIDRLATEMMARFNRERPIVYTTIQMYRHDRLDFLAREWAAAEQGGYQLGIKFVRGAYMEKERARAEGRGVPSPIHPTKEATDRAYDQALAYAMARIDRIAICAGTHNEASSQLLTELMAKAGLERKDPRVFFSQLLGMSDHLSYNLADEGYNVAKYVPFGPVRAVFPYLVRRAQENTSIQGQTSRELSLIVEERRRRSARPALSSPLRVV